MTDLEKLIAFLKRLMVERFYGKVQISFESGKIGVIKKEETIKL